MGAAIDASKPLGTEEQSILLTIRQQPRSPLWIALRTLSVAADISAASVAREAGISKQLLSLIALGQCRATPENRERIMGALARILDVRPGDVPGVFGVDRLFDEATP